MMDRNGAIDLVEIVRVLWQKKRIIILITLLGMCISFIYLNMSKQLFEAKASIDLPIESDIANFNLFLGKINFVSLDELHNIFIRKLNSEESQNIFFEKVLLPALATEASKKVSKAVLLHQFKNELNVSRYKSEKLIRYNIVVVGTDPLKVTELVKKYSSFVYDEIFADISNLINKKKELTVFNLKHKHEAMLKLALKKRMDRIAQLNEAIHIANSNPKLLINKSNIKSDILLSTDPSLMYLRGVSALKAEIENLNTRKSDVPFIKNLHELENNINFYTNLNMRDISNFFIHREGEKSEHGLPVYRNGALYILRSIFLGFICGVLLVIYLYVLYPNFKRIIATGIPGGSRNSELLDKPSVRK